MANIIALKKRIKSVSNIAKITKAMEMVSASKMRQAQSQALASRHYSRKLDEILGKIGNVIDTSMHPLLQGVTSTNKTAILVISTDRGLTGSLTTNLFRSIEHFQTDHKADIYTIGRLAKEYAIKSNSNLVAEFGSVEEKISYEATQPIASLLIREFLNQKYKEVYVAYMDFISTLVQKPRIVQLLPIRYTETADTSQFTLMKEYTFEPDPKTLLNSLLPYSVELKLYQAMLEARASEHSARMVAMKNASDNAKELGRDLNLRYNQSRQANITNELADIITASMSVAA